MTLTRNSLIAFTWQQISTGVLLLTLLSCTQATIPLSSLPPKGPKINPESTLLLSIESLNLSEDLSKTLSTNNDELLVLIYVKKADGSLDAPLYQKILLLDTDHMQQNLFIEKGKIPEGEDLLFLLLEQDYETPIEQIDPIIRVQHRQVIEAFKKRDYRKMRTYLGTEDMLGYKTIEDFSYSQDIRFDITGVYKADFYEYKIRLTGNWPR